MKQALVRFYAFMLTYNLLTVNLQDVTTRGSYYPDKSMATAVVSHSRISMSEANLTSLESAAVLARY